MKKRIVSILIIAVMSLCFLPTLSFADTAEFEGGSGTKDDPYLVSTKYQLDNVRNYLGAYFKLTCDIEFEDADFAEGGYFYNEGAGWVPIGSNRSYPFTGAFDGNGYAVKNLYVKVSSSDAYAGLFGYNTGVIKNLGVIGGSISSIASAYSYAGGICGYNNSGKIVNCYNTATIYAGGMVGYAGGIVGSGYYCTVENCYNYGKISAYSGSGDTYSGGIIGRGFDSKITACYNEGYVTGSPGGARDGNVGGIAGRIEWNTLITNCYNTGTCEFKTTNRYTSVYVGGISGYSSAGVINCYNVGEILVSSQDYAGGIVGRKNTGTSKNCYYIDNINKGMNETDTAIKCTSDELKEAATYVGFDFESVWAFDSTSDYPYPQLISNWQTGSRAPSDDRLPRVVMNDEGNGVVTDMRDSWATRIYWGYIGSEETPYKWFDDFRLSCGLTYTSDFAPRDAREYYFTEVGYYRFVLRCIVDGNSKDTYKYRDTVYTFYYDGSAEIAVPTVIMTDDNTVRISTNGTNVTKLYYGNIGGENLSYSWFNDFWGRALGTKTYTPVFTVNDGDEYKLITAGYYNFVIVYEKDGKSYELVYTVQAKNDAPVIKTDDSTVVLDFDAVAGATVKKLYWGYIGNENTGYTTFEQFKAECGDTFVSDFVLQNDDEFLLTQAGFYRFVVNYILSNGKVIDVVYTVEN